MKCFTGAIHRAGLQCVDGAVGSPCDVRGEDEVGWHVNTLRSRTRAPNLSNPDRLCLPGTDEMTEWTPRAVSPRLRRAHHQLAAQKARNDSSLRNVGGSRPRQVRRDVNGDRLGDACSSCCDRHMRYAVQNLQASVANTGRDISYVC